MRSVPVRLGILRLLTLATGALALAATAHAQPSSNSPALDEAGVRAAVTKRIEGRLQLNAALSAEPFADDAVWINAFGRRLVGRRTIESFLEQLYSDPGYRSRDEVQRPEIAEIVFVRPDVAVARVFAVNRGQRLPNGTVIAERRSHNTMTLTRESDGWKVRYEIVTDERSATPR